MIRVLALAAASLTLIPASHAANVDVESRDNAMKRTKVWMQPKVAISDADLSATADPIEGWGANDIVECRHKAKESGGMTPKFYCEQKGIEGLLKVKPSILGGEAISETAATRLLTVLGFGADRMYLVKAVKCRGCPRLPYKQLGWFGRMVRIGKVRTFENAAIEIKFDATEIETVEKGEGWGVYELDQVDASLGGASRAEIDALRLMMVFLGHWDNKAENQRLTCLHKIKKDSPYCSQPFAFVQDAGKSFGPNMKDIGKWSQRKIWADSEKCLVNLFDHPWNGGTFGEVQISEEGRQFLASLLTQLSRKQIRDLFAGARFSNENDPARLEQKLESWVKAFEDKVAQIATHPGCPAITDGGFTRFPKPEKN